MEAIQKYGGARAGSRTMLDAMLTGCEALEAAAAKGGFVSRVGVALALGLKRCVKPQPLGPLNRNNTF